MAEGDNRQAADIPVLSKDPEKKDDDKPKANGANGKLKDEKDEPEIVCPNRLELARRLLAEVLT